MPYYPNVRYNSVPRQDANNTDYYQVHANSTLVPSTRVQASNAGPRVLRPPVVWVPVGPQLCTWDVTIGSALSSLSTSTTIPVKDTFDSQPTFNGSQISTLGGSAGASGIGSAFGTDRFWTHNPYLLVDPIYHNTYNLENGTNASISTDTTKDTTAHLAFARSRNFRNITPWSSWMTADPTYPADPGLTHTHPYELLYQWRHFTNFTASPTDVWTFVRRSEVAVNPLQNDQVCWVPVDTATGCYLLNQPGDIFDFTAAPLQVQAYGTLSVTEYEDYYRISMTNRFQLQEASVSPSVDSARDSWTSGSSDSGRLDFKSHFPGSDPAQGSITRFVNYFRPSPQGTNVPLACHQGWNFVTSMGGGVVRFVYDNKVDTGSGLSMMLSDTIFLEFGHAGLATLDARRLKLPSPTIESAIGFTKPWNTEPGVVGIQSNEFDISFLTKDQLDWQVSFKGVNANARSSWYTTSNSNPHLHFMYEVGFITRTLTFTGDMPYVTRTRGPYSSTGF